MFIAKTFSALRSERAKLPGPVGLVPTMGFLHPGHLSLVERAAKECKSVIVSIFVNPTQFGPQEDFGSYPRDISKDLELLEQFNVDLVWIPKNEDMYPSGYQTWVEVNELTRHLEAEMRPGHFKGVATVVTKLFTGVQPNRAYFGQKDAQQCLVIKRLVTDLNFPIEVVVCPIVREMDGLAMSSRNVYLNHEERRAATVLHRSLKVAEEAYLNGENNSEKIRQIIRKKIEEEPLASIQYISCANPDSLQEHSGTFSKALLSMAVKFGNTRLIDNLLIGT